MTGMRRCLCGVAAAALCLATPVTAVYDVVERLLALQDQGVIAPRLALTSSELPDSMQTRISRFNLDWDSLSGLLQRALLWDSGFVLTGDHSYVQIFTGTGRSMAEMQVDITAVNASVHDSTTAGCKLQTCTATRSAFLSSKCKIDMLAQYVGCAINGTSAAIPKAGNNTVFWAQDGSTARTDVLNPIVREHPTSDGGEPMYAIHLTDDGFDGTDACGLQGDFIIPCRSASLGFFVADISTAVEMWLQLTADENTTFSSTAKVLIGVLLVLLAGLAAAMIVIMRASRRLQRGQHARGSSQALGTSSMPFITYSQCEVHTQGQTQTRTRTQTQTQTHTQTLTQTRSDPTVFESKEDALQTNQALTAQSAVLRRFVSDKAILAKRISISQITMLRALSKGATGEVWLGQFESRYIAVKCLLPGRRNDVHALEQFSEEIRMAASLEHPRVVQFHGIVWNVLTNLSIVTEYMERGDLEGYLSLPAAKTMTWAREKLTLAQDTAEALVYLHSLTPVVIHRDLKSKNIMLDRNLRAKLSDFGLTRESSTEATMTSGIGTILWSAPEVLEGKQYDEKADIFSLGIVLSEIDTCALPYGVNQEGGRSKMKSMQIVHLVSEGKLLPNFRDDCPREIVELAQSCLRLDPTQRPSAMQIVFALRAKIFPLLNGGNGEHA